MNRTQRIGRDVIASLLSHKQRALLMMLGVAIGVAVLSAVIAIAQGTSTRVMELVQNHNLDMIMVRAGGEVQVFAPQVDRGLVALLPEDARAIEAEVPNVELVSVVQAQRGIDLVYEDRSTATRVFGVDPSFSEIRYRPWQKESSSPKRIWPQWHVSPISGTRWPRICSRKVER